MKRYHCIFNSSKIFVCVLLTIVKLLSAENLQRYATEHVIYGDYMFDIWDEVLIQKVLGFLSPENMRIDVVSKSSSKTEGDSRICQKSKERRMFVVHLFILFLSILLSIYSLLRTISVPLYMFLLTYGFY